MPKQKQIIMSKDLFMELRLQDQLQYPHDFSKVEAKQQGKQLAQRILDDGKVTPEQAVSQLARLTEVLNNSFKHLKDNLEIDKEVNVNGVKLSHVQGGAIYDFAKDAVWAHYEDKISKLKAQQKEREKKLLQATKSDDVVLDDGEIVSAIPVKSYRKSYIKILF